MKPKLCYRRKISLFTSLFIIMILSASAGKLITSGVYDWNRLQNVKNHTGWVRNILKGPTQSLKMFDIKAVTIDAGKKTQTYFVEKGCDELIIIKEGSAEITINTESKLLNEGSIAVASQGDRISMKNPKNGNLIYYSFRFKPKQGKPAQITSGRFKPFYEEWDTITFKPSANGGRRNIINQATSAMKQLEIHVTTLNEGVSSHAPHAHPDEELILVRFGIVEMTIKGTPYRLGPGSVIFLTGNDLHGGSNAGEGKCEYYAIRWVTTTEKAN
ncbi:MAG: cupin domain-containing protein [Bacteroidales bacterium]|nr:cupin domain-containing protein [Bacteroidales bacterium]